MHTAGVVPVACASCAAPLPLTDAALRRGMVACGHCGVAQRVGDRVATPLERPAGVRVVDAGDERAWHVPRVGTSFAVNRRELVCGAVAGGVGAVLAGGLGLPAGLGLVAGAVVGVLVPGALLRSLPPLRVSPVRLVGTSGFYAAVPRERLAQVHVACVQLGPAAPKELCSVWALTDDGRRHHLAGPVRDLETALWLEQELELFLQIAEREVVGATAAPTPVPGPEPSAAHGRHLRDRSCAACGAPLATGAHAALRGFLVCGCCGGVALVAPAGSEPAGTPEPEMPPELDVRVDDDGVTVVVLRTGARVRGTARGLVLDDAGGPAREIAATAVVVRLQRVGDLAGLWQGLTQKMAYSGARDQAQDLADAAGARFVVEARVAEGPPIALVADLRRVRDAVAAADALRAAVGLSAAT